MRHAEHDLLHAKRAAALDDLLKRRDHGLGAVKSEALGAGEFQVAEFLEALGFDQLVEDCALALAGEADLFVLAFDALLQPGLLRCAGDVHELEADGLAVGPTQDADHLAQRGEFQPQHFVEEDRPVIVCFGESVGARIEFLFRLFLLELERIELGVEMSADAIGADQHQGADGIAGRLLHLLGGKLDAPGLRRSLQLVADGFGRFRPFAGECGEQIAALACGPIRPLPRGAARDLRHFFGTVLQAFEEFPPLRVDRVGILLVAGVEVLDIGRVATVEKRGKSKGGIRVLAGHATDPDWRASRNTLPIMILPRQGEGIGRHLPFYPT